MIRREKDAQEEIDKDNLKKKAAQVISHLTREMEDRKRRPPPPQKKLKTMLLSKAPAALHHWITKPLPVTLSCCCCLWLLPLTLSHKDLAVPVESLLPYNVTARHQCLSVLSSCGSFLLVLIQVLMLLSATVL